MTTRISNVSYLTVLPSPGLDGVGWTVRALSERDYTSMVADVSWFSALGFTVEANQEGGATLTLDSDDAVLTGALPAGETARLVDQEALWQVLEDGQVRFEFLAEDVDEDVIPDGGGPRQTVITGRGTGSVLEWAPVLPAGMPTPTSMSRDFTAHPMAAWVQLFQEAQADGYLEWVTLTFGADADSEGAAWTSGAQALTVNAGDTLLDLLKRWCEANELAWKMQPGFRLDVRQSAGVRHEDRVVFTQYRSQGEHKRKITRRDLANVIFADSGDNGLAYAEDATSVTKWRKRAAWLSAGDSADASARSMVANTSLTLSKDQRLSRTVRIIPDKVGRHPFIDFDVHDWISVEVPDDDTESGARKVMGLAVDISADGVVEYEATLSSRFEVRAVKIQRLLDKLGGSERSGSGSAAASPIVVSKALSAVKLEDLSNVDITSPSAGSLLQFSGGRWIDVAPNLDMLADVDTGTVPGSGTVGLLYDRPSGLWKPTVLPAAGGGSAATYLERWPAIPLTGTAAANSTSSKGSQLLCRTNATVSAYSVAVATVAAVSYRLGFYEITPAATGSALIAAVLHEVTTTPGVSAGLMLSASGLSLNVDRGKTYAVIVTRMDGLTCQTISPVGATWGGGLFQLSDLGPWIRATLTPAVGSAYSQIASPGPGFEITGTLR